MFVQVDTNVTPSLHPANVAKIDGYNEATKGYVAGTVQAFHEAYSGVSAVFAAREAAKKDMSLTDGGRLMKLDDMAQRVFKKVARIFDTERANLEKGIAQLENQLTAPVAARASHTMASEIRAFVRAMSPPERAAFIYNAIRDGDTTTAESCLGAPAYLSGIEPNVASALLRKLHERSAPHEAAKLKVMTAAKALLENRGGLLFDQLEAAVGAQPHEVRALREAKARSEQAFAH